MGPRVRWVVVWVGLELGLELGLESRWVDLGDWRWLWEERLSLERGLESLWRIFWDGNDVIQIFASKGLWPTVLLLFCG